METKLKIEFGTPQYDWLPVVLIVDDFHLEFKASGVLSDPLAELVSCLLLVTQGIEASVNWWLEPAELSFQFSIESHTIQLMVVESKDAHSQQQLPKQQLLCVSASYKAIVLPFWRALQKLNPAAFDEENWYPLPLEKLQKLAQLVRIRKQLV